MRTLLIATLAVIPLATTASAGGYGFTLPHLTWPEPAPQPEVPTRLCAPGVTVTSETPCAPSN